MMAIKFHRTNTLNERSIPELEAPFKFLQDSS